MIHCKVYKIPVISLRLSVVYMEQDLEHLAHTDYVWSFLIQRFQKKLTIVGDGKQTRDFTYVSDVVEAILKGAI